MKNLLRVLEPKIALALSGLVMPAALGCDVSGACATNQQAGSSRAELPFKRPAPLRDISPVFTTSARDNGAIPDDGLDDLPAIADAIEEAIQSQVPARVDMEPGVYDIYTSVPQSFPLRIDNANNLVLDGNDAEFVVHNPQAGFMEVANSKNVIVRNLAVDYDPLPFIQGVVRKVNYVTGAVEVEGADGFPKIDDEHFVNSREWQWGAFRIKKGILKDSQDVGKLKSGVPNTIPSISQKRVSDTRFRINVTPYYVGHFRPGDHYVHLARGGPAVFKATRSEQVTFDNLTVYTGPGAAFLSGGSSLVNLIGSKTMMREQRWLSTCADGIIAYRNRIGPWIEGSVFEGVGDDAININTSAGVCTQRVKGDTFVIGGRLDHRGIRQVFSAEPGDHVRVYNPVAGVLIGEADVLTVEPMPQDSALVVTLSDEIGDIVVGDDESASVFYNNDTQGGHFVIRNNLFRNTRRYGVLAQSHDGVIEDNVFRGVSGNGIVLMNTIHSGSGFAPRNISISRNWFEDCYPQQVTSRGRSHAAIIATVVEKQGYAVAPWQGVENITIENNTIVNWNHVDAIRISNGRNVRIQGNTLISTAEQSLWRRETPLPFAFENSTNISVLDNSIEDCRLSQGRYARIGKNVSGITFTGNEMN